ncbi:hypothetical protein SHEWT2_04141 [Shewanella hafniensis]|nr:hypothetical protein SHEWT2_04141 [Shewanella hafniensis]
MCGWRYAYILVLLIVAFSSKLSTYLILVLLFLLFVLGCLNTIYVEDIGYVLYFMCFCVSLIYLKNELLADKLRLSIPLIRITFLFTTFFFWLYIFGIDSSPHQSDMSATGANVEYYRVYHSGLFRAPHFPSYLFYFIALTYIYFRRSFSWFEFYFVITICIFGVLFSGSRTPVFSFVLATIIYFTISRLRYVVLSLVFVCLLSIIFYKIEVILEMLSGTSLYQYFSFIYTLKNDPDRLSRIILFSVFLDSIQNFSLSEILVGRSFGSQLDIIEQSISQRLWFHNDILSVFYSYGLVGILVLFSLLKALYFKFIRVTKSYYVNVYFISIVVFSFVNGIFYHTSYLFLLFLFWMIMNEFKTKNINFVCKL